MSKFNTLLADIEKRYGSVTVDGIKYVLTQDAYFYGTHEAPHYQALAIDIDGNEYMVEWDVVDGYEQMDDASDHCDWEKPREVIPL